VFLHAVEVVRELSVLKYVSTVKTAVEQSLSFDPRSRTALIVKPPQILYFKVPNSPLVPNEEVTLLASIF